MARSINEVHTINYYPINEGAARRAKEMNSFSDYKEGSATAESHTSHFLLTLILRI